jgi:hypothetical protein
LQPDENTGDCKISYIVVATTDVMRLQKKLLLKTSMCVIATLSQCDLQKNSCKKTACDCDCKKTVAKKQVKCDYSVVATADVLRLQKTQLQKPAYA